MNRTGAILATLGMMGLLVGCGRSNRQEAVKEATRSQSASSAKASPTNQEVVTREVVTREGAAREGAAREAAAREAAAREAAARDKLKEGLDAWVFGDSQETFCKSHPRFDFMDMDIHSDMCWSSNAVLLRYEIVASRRTTDDEYEFVVVLVFQSHAGTEIKNKVKYKAYFGRDEFNVYRYD